MRINCGQNTRLLLTRYRHNGVNHVIINESKEAKTLMNMGKIAQALQKSGNKQPTANRMQLLSGLNEAMVALASKLMHS